MGHMLGFIFLFILFGLLIVGGVFVGIFKMFRSPAKGGDAADEARMIQEMYNAMNRMEQRVESLETILLEKEKKE